MLLQWFSSVGKSDQIVKKFFFRIYIQELYTAHKGREQIIHRGEWCYVLKVPQMTALQIPHTAAPVCFTQRKM